MKEIEIYPDPIATLLVIYSIGLTSVSALVILALLILG